MYIGCPLPIFDKMLLVPCILCEALIVFYLLEYDLIYAIIVRDALHRLPEISSQKRASVGLVIGLYQRSAFVHLPERHKVDGLPESIA